MRSNCPGKRCAAGRIVVIAVAALLATSPAVATQSVEPVGTAAAEPWREDLAHFAHYLVTTHGDVFNTLGQPEFEGLVADLTRRIPRLARHEIIVEMQRIAAAIGDGHTVVPLFFDSDVAFHRLPLQLGWYEEGMFVEAARPDAGIEPGARLVAIGGVEIAEAIGRITPLISRDNDIWIRTMSPLFLASPEVLHAVGLSDQPTSAVLTVERNGRIRDVRIGAEEEAFSLSHGLGAGAVPAGWNDARESSATGTPALWRRHPGRAYWYEYLPAERVLYIQYNMVNDAPEGPGVHEFFADALRVLDEHPVDRVALDIRRNTGGEGGLNADVVKMLVRRTELDRPGALLVIIGRRTFSAAQLLAHELDRWTGATFVGEPTGSSPQFWGDHRFTELEHSGIDVSASPTWWQPGGPYDQREFLPPLLAFEPRFEDYVADRDPVMDAILDWENQELGLGNDVTHALANGDTAAAAAIVRDWDANPVHRYRPATTELNRLGYRLLADDRAATALSVFRLNVDLHPRYANGWDSLGEALFRVDRHEEALAAYRRAYELDPQVGNAAAVLGRSEH